jgi:carbonic anhydrase/acetyltransferase-like protein (isoleucine patch superfamily)
MTGAGAIVTRNSAIGEREIWVGVPAKLLKTRASLPGKEKA